MELAGECVAVLRVDENDGHCGWDAGHHGQEVGEAVLFLQLVETDVWVGGLSRGEAGPVDGAERLLERAKVVVKTATLHIRLGFGSYLQP